MPCEHCIRKDSILERLVLLWHQRLGPGFWDKAMGECVERAEDELEAGDDE